jgi:hypothetical protein
VLDSSKCDGAMGLGVRRMRARTSVFDLYPVSAVFYELYTSPAFILNLYIPSFLLSPGSNLENYWVLAPQIVRSSPREFPEPGQLVINASHPDTVNTRGPVPIPIPHTGDKIATVSGSLSIQFRQTVSLAMYGCTLPDDDGVQRGHQRPGAGDTD